MKKHLETMWYGATLGVFASYLQDHYFHNVAGWEVLVTLLLSYLLGEHLMVKFDRWRIKRKVRREVIKAIKDQGLNPKDFEIGFDKVKITQTDDPDYDVLTLKTKDRNDEEV